MKIILLDILAILSFSRIVGNVAFTICISKLLEVQLAAGIVPKILT